MSSGVCHVSDVDYLSRLEKSTQISLLTSHIDFLHSEGPYCLRVPTNDKSKDIILDPCKKSFDFNPIDENTQMKITDKMYKDNIFYHDPNTQQIKAGRDRNGCIYVDVMDEDKIKYTQKGCNKDNQKQKFIINHQYKQIESVAVPGKCLTASDFTKETENNFKTKTGIDVSQKKIILQTCPYIKLNDVTPFDPKSDGMFAYGNLRDITDVVYTNLSQKFQELLKLTDADIANIKKEFDKQLKLLSGELDLTNGLYKDQVEANKKLRSDVKSSYKESFEQINTQTAMIKQKLKELRTKYTTDHKRNLYQLEQNQIIKKAHTILFWIYFVFAFVFILILGFAIGPVSIYFIGALVVTVVYPFIILFIEYGFVFVYYFIEALIMGRPFQFNKQAPTNSVFFIP